MSPRRSALLLWCVLVLLLPLPVAGEQWGWWPPLRLLHHLLNTHFDSALVAQLLLCLLVLVAVVYFYARVAPRLPPKWAGALVGLACWGLLVLMSTVAWYRAPLAAAPWQTLQVLYRTESATVGSP